MERGKGWEWSGYEGGTGMIALFFSIISLILSVISLTLAIYGEMLITRLNDIKSKQREMGEEQE